MAETISNSMKFLVTGSAGLGSKDEKDAISLYNELLGKEIVIPAN
jgi:hypothetical protein